MRKGSLPRSIAQALPEPVGYNFAPDGLDLATIDDLIEEAAANANPRPRPAWLSSDVVEQRRARRTVRQIVRMLPAIGSETVADDPEAA
jgi:hypothetical protein